MRAAARKAREVAKQATPGSAEYPGSLPAGYLAFAFHRLNVDSGESEQLGWIIEGPEDQARLAAADGTDADGFDFTIEEDELGLPVRQLVNGKPAGRIVLLGEHTL